MLRFGAVFDRFRAGFRSKTAPRPSKTAPKRSKTAAKRSKTAPRRSKTAGRPKARFELSFWIRLGSRGKKVIPCSTKTFSDLFVCKRNKRFNCCSRQLLLKFVCFFETPYKSSCSGILFLAGFLCCASWCPLGSCKLFNPSNYPKRQSFKNGQSE